ncbi:hypothetical protein [Micromonospora sp. S-DT3-3-22]|uniref:hypothetical protein n=1 Tax=Micromonospora sp. S-DT3-3-22 TaxID=2755359 RepID=UPI00188E0448|nr:hypothetical protein [Micromonospora sp. S-DT3-3-22]
MSVDPAPGQPLRWALHSKHPDRFDDYAVIADSSGGRERRELGRLIRQSLPGAPQVTASGAGGLPWVTFAGSGGHLDARERLGISLVDWEPTGARDRSGRPIAATRYFDIPFIGTETAPGYRELYAAVVAVALPASCSLAPALPPANLDHLAEDIDGLGFEWVASLAALLLHMPVMITAEEFPALDDRIRCLDAVAALLPRGFRADLVVGTWTPNMDTHQIRLAFADRVKEGQHQVGWQVQPDLSTLSGPAPAYLTQLLRLRQRTSTRGVVDRLWRRSTPLPSGADGATIALRYLHEEDRPYHTMVRYREGSAGPGEARTALEETPSALLEPEVRGELLRRLAVEATDADLVLLDRLWCPETVPVLTGLVGDVPTELVERYAVLVERHHESARFWQGIIEAASPDTSPGDRARLARFLAGLPVPVDESGLRGALHANPAFCVDLVAAAVDAGPVCFVPWLRWLTVAGPSPKWLAPFAAACRPDVPLVPGDVVALAEWGQRMVVAVLTVARDAGTIPVVLPGLWPDLARIDPGPVRRAGVAALAGLPTQPARTEALIDLLLAVWEELPAAAGPVDPVEYALAVSNQLAAWLAPPRRRVVVLRLIHGLTNPPPKSEGITRAVALTERLLSEQIYQDLPSALLPAVEAAPETLRLLPALLQQLLLQMSAPLRMRRLLDRLTGAVANGIDEHEVIELWAEGVHLGCRPEDVLWAIHRWPDAAHPAQLFAVVEGLLHRLLATGHQAVVPAVQAAHEAILAGALGDQMATDYRAYLTSVGRPLHLHSTAVNRALVQAGKGRPLVRLWRYRRRRRQ